MKKNEMHVARARAFCEEAESWSKSHIMDLRSERGAFPICVEDIRALLSEIDALALKLDWAASKAEDIEDRMAGARDAAHAAGRKEALEEAAGWHDQRAKLTPDAFEQEFHEKSCDAIRAFRHQKGDTDNG